MKLKKHLNLRLIFVGFYMVSFLGFLIYGLQPTEAARSYSIDGRLLIPSIEFDEDVTELELVDGELETPDTIVGSYARYINKTLLIGHSTTVFSNLVNVELGDEIKYDDRVYTVEAIEVLKKDEIDMDELLKADGKDTIVIMTCAGELLGDGDATHRLIITASGE